MNNKIVNTFVKLSAVGVPITVKSARYWGLNKHVKCVSGEHEGKKGVITAINTVRNEGSRVEGDKEVRESEETQKVTVKFTDDSTLTTDKPEKVLRYIPDDVECIKSASYWCLGEQVTCISGEYEGQKGKITATKSSRTDDDRIEDGKEIRESEETQEVTVTFDNGSTLTTEEPEKMLSQFQDAKESVG